MPWKDQLAFHNNSFCIIAYEKAGVKRKNDFHFLSKSLLSAGACAILSLYRPAIQGKEKLL